MVFGMYRYPILMPPKEANNRELIRYLHDNNLPSTCACIHCYTLLVVVYSSDISALLRI